MGDVILDTHLQEGWKGDSTLTKGRARYVLQLISNRPAIAG